MSGPSKYDELARGIVLRLDAEAAVVIVVGGTKGSGACPALRMDGKIPHQELKRVVARALRAMADGIESDTQPGRTDWHTEES